MKKITTMILCAVICALMMAIAPATYAQVSKEQKQEVKAQKKNQKETEKDVYGKSPKSVRHYAKQLEKDAWKSMNLPIDKQVEATWMRMYEKDPATGRYRYITATEESTANTFAAAQMQADNICKVRIAGLIQTLVLSEAKMELANEQISALDAASITKALEKSTNMVAQKLFRQTKTMEIYKIVNNNYIVRATIAYDMDKIMDMVKTDAVQSLQKELDSWTPTYEKLIDDIIDGAKSQNTPRG